MVELPLISESRRNRRSAEVVGRSARNVTRRALAKTERKRAMHFLVGRMSA